MPTAPTLVLAEDNALLREGLAATLQRFHFEIRGQVATAADALAEVDRLRPQLLLTDVRMPPSFTDEGLRAAIEARRRHPDLAVVVLSQYVERPAARRLLAPGHGRTGYLLKDRVADVRTLTDTLRRVLAGETVIDAHVVGRLLKDPSEERLDQLTSRERQTLALMAQGLSNAAIARNLVITEATVAKHIRSIFDKLNLTADADDHHRRVLAVLTHLG